MELKPYLKQIGDEAVEALATRCGTSARHLINISYRCKSCAPSLAVDLERESGNAVRRWELRPTDWHRIWPELVKAKGAPAVDVAKAA